MANPAATGTPAPTIEFSPKKRWAGRDQMGGAAATSVDTAGAVTHLGQQGLHGYAACERPAMPTVGGDDAVASVSAARAPTGIASCPAQR